MNMENNISRKEYMSICAKNDKTLKKAKKLLGDKYRDGDGWLNIIKKLEKQKHNIDVVIKELLDATMNLK